MKTMTTQELQQRMDEGPLAVFDVRGDLEFEQGHIPGAKTAPLGSLTFRVASLMNPGSMVVVYGDGDGSGRDLATEAAERLEGLRMSNVHVYAQGLAGWQQAGLPVVPSIDPKAHTRGPVVDVRPLVVDRENAYGGAFKGDPVDGEGAGG